MNYFVTGGDRREYGPIDEGRVRQWIHERRLSAGSPAMAEGGKERKPLRTFPEFAEDLNKADPTSRVPPVSAPPVLPETGGVDSDRLASEICERDYSINIGRCIRRGLDLVFQNFWVVVGAAFVLMLIQGSLGILAGVCAGGLDFLLLRLIRKQTVTFGDAFAGFSLAFLPLFLAGLVSSVLMGVGLLFCLLPGIYLLVAWVFAFPLIIDKRMDFWAAMELSRKVVNRHWWKMLGFLLVSQVLLNVVGLMVCCVGILISQPIGVAALMCAYEDIFGSQGTEKA
jgi:hypothetical protein